jgi:hypothetical protein
MGSGPVCAMVWEGREVVKTGRQILGATNPLASQPGTIRGDFAIVSPLFHQLGIVTASRTNTCLGRRPQRLPRLRRRRVRPEGDRSLVRQERDPELEAGSARLGLREVDFQLPRCMRHDR